jgi:hypothetical protein
MSPVRIDCPRLRANVPARTCRQRQRAGRCPGCTLEVADTQPPSPHRRPWKRNPLTEVKPWH